MQAIIVHPEHVQQIVAARLQQRDFNELIGAGYYLGMRDAFMMIASQMVEGSAMEQMALMIASNEIISAAVAEGIHDAVAQTGIEPRFKVGDN